MLHLLFIRGQSIYPSSAPRAIRPQVQSRLGPLPLFPSKPKVLPSTSASHSDTVRRQALELTVVGERRRSSDPHPSTLVEPLLHSKAPQGNVTDVDDERKEEVEEGGRAMMLVQKQELTLLKVQVVAAQIQVEEDQVQAGAEENLPPLLPPKGKKGTGRPPVAPKGAGRKVPPPKTLPLPLPQGPEISSRVPDSGGDGPGWIQGVGSKASDRAPPPPKTTTRKIKRFIVKNEWSSS